MDIAKGNKAMQLVKHLRHSFVLMSLLAINAQLAQGQLKSDPEFAKSKQAFAYMEVDLAALKKNETTNPLFELRTTKDIVRQGLGIPRENTLLASLEKVSLYIGHPEYNVERTDFLAQFEFSSAAALKKNLDTMLDMDEKAKADRIAMKTNDDGWTVLTLKGRANAPIIRYREKQLEIGSVLYVYSPDRQIASPLLVETFNAIPKSPIRVAMDTRRLGAFVETIFERESVRDRSLRRALQYGDFIDEDVLLVYLLENVKHLKTATLFMDPDAEKVLVASATSKSTAEFEPMRNTLGSGFHFVQFLGNSVSKVFAEENESAGTGAVKLLMSGLKFSEDKTRSKVTISYTKPKNFNKQITSLVKGIFQESVIQQDLNRIRMVGLAMHNFHSVYRKFPIGQEIRNMHDDYSWRVKLMPYLEHSVSYSKLDLSKSWDDKGNRKLLESAEESFRMRDGALICMVERDRPPTSMAQIIDGTSNTIMAICNPDAAMQPWAQKGDLTIDAALDIVKSATPKNPVVVVMYDGSVQRIESSKGFSDEEIKNFFDHRDGNPVREGLFKRNGTRRIRRDRIDRPRAIKDRVIIEEIKEAQSDCESSK